MSVAEVCSLLVVARSHTARKLHRKEIEALLGAGVTVIVDRYAYSGIAYTLAKDRIAQSGGRGKAPEFSYEWCIACERGLLRPDAVVYFDIDVETALRRGEASGKAQERYETAAFLAAVRAVYEDEFREEGFLRVDARAPPDEITERVVAIVAATMERVRHQSTSRI